MSVLFLLVWTDKLRAAELSRHTNRNNNNIKHRASSAQPCLLLFVKLPCWKVDTDLNG